jgi:NADH-quinone oxidoreductase subunit C
MSNSHEESFTEDLKAHFKDKILEIKAPMKRRLFIKVTPESYRDVIKFLVKEKQVLHVSTMTGIDLGEKIEVMPHFFGLGMEISIQVDIQKEKPEIPSITSLVPGVVLYEREIHDLLGVNFIGHPDLSRLILPDDWPEGVYPLRKDYQVQPPKRLREV